MGDPALEEQFVAIYDRVHAYAARRLGAHAADDVAAAIRRAPAAEPPRPAAGGEEDPALWEAWSELSAGDREVLALVAWEELPVRDAARVVGCPAPVFSVRLHRARKRLERHRPVAGSIPTLSEVP